MITTKRKRTANQAVEISLTQDERSELLGFAGSRSLPHSLVQRAKIVLSASEGLTNFQIAAQVGLSRESVGKWRGRYAREGLAGIYDQMRSARPRTLGDEQISEIATSTLSRKPQATPSRSLRA